MISNYLFPYNPPQELLDQCTLIVLKDPEKIKHIKHWATEHCHSFLWMEEVDTSDVDPLYDLCYGFYFWDQKDVLIFKMKYAEWT
jgi:hypothetical protein